MRPPASEQEQNFSGAILAVVKANPKAVTADTKPDDLNEALGIVNVEYDAVVLNAKAKKVPPDPPPKIENWPPFGELTPLSVEEGRQLESLRDLVLRFALQKGHSHPLCLAVFGPPGSGKSFAVKQIHKEAFKGSAIKASLLTINLTQVSTSTEITEGLMAASITAAQEPEQIPLIFFDEFDTMRDGSPYGWLSWFLAPMHDGEFLHSGKNIGLKRAIYVFAGGTASTMAEFSSRQADPIFRNAKGPDFISRLRGYLDVKGPNSEPRMLRRSLILRAEFEKRVRRHGKGTFRINKQFLEALLQAGRYRHGARSIAALIELGELGGDELGWELLPENHLVELHVDRGPLDAKAISGSIALSGFRPAPDSNVDDENIKGMEECWSAVATALWNEGATLAYGGRWIGRGIALAKLLTDELSTRPAELRRDLESRSAPRPRFRLFLKSFDSESAAREVDLTESQRASMGVELVTGDYLDDEERAWGSKDWRARVIERFRRRLAVSEASVARFIIGGHSEDDSDRPSGIVEETVLSLALGRPIYVAGAFGGAARVMGTLLGLSEIRTGAVPGILFGKLEPDRRAKWSRIADRLRPPPLTTLPVLPEEQVVFLQDHALDGTKWPQNGLTADENRRLFRSTDPEVVARLVCQGLVSLAKKVAASSTPLS